MSEERLARVHAEVSRHLAEISTLFVSTAKLTLLVRSDLGPGKDGDLVVTDDTLEAAIAALSRRLDAQ